MSISVLSDVWMYSQAKLASRLVLLAIADFSNENGDAYPAIKTLAKKSGISERNCQYAIRKLCEMGELAIFENAGPHGVNLYRVQLLRGAKSAIGGCKMEQPPVQNGAGKLSPFAPNPSGTVKEPSEEPLGRKSGFVGTSENPKPDLQTVVTRFIELGKGIPPELLGYWQPEVEAEQFLAHFEANGWKIGGKTKMISWESATVTWRGRWVEKNRQAERRAFQVAPDKVLAAIRDAIEKHPCNPKSQRHALMKAQGQLTPALVEGYKDLLKKEASQQQRIIGQAA